MKLMYPLPQLDIANAELSPNLLHEIPHNMKDFVFNGTISFTTNIHVGMSKVIQIHVKQSHALLS